MYVGGDPKVSKGERRKAGIQWIQPPKAVSDPEFRQTTGGTHGSANRADCLPRGKSLCFLADYGPKGCRGRAESPLLAATGNNFAESSPPWWGMTRRLWRVGMACSPMGRSIASSGDPKGVQGGNVGKRVPSGHNRRRQLAPRSSGKQQAERTAVRAAPIVCPEESPPVRPQAHTLPH